MAGILPMSKAKGVDFFGLSDDNCGIVRSDLGCYMYASNFHEGLDLKIYSLHPCCKDGDHYLACDDGTFYVIKGNSYRRVSDMSRDLHAVVGSLHPNCQGGDYYLSVHGCFFIIFKSRGVFHRTSNMNKDSDAVEYPLHPDCKDGLYYWGTKSYFYFLKPKDEWGIHYKKSLALKCLFYPFCAQGKFSIHPDVLNFLPGGLAETLGPAFGKWELIKMFSNDSETPLTWEKKINRKVGYTKSKSSSIEHNWKVSISASYSAGDLAKAIAKFQFSMSAEYGGQVVNTESETWEEATEVEESVNLTLQPHKRIYLWQYKLGFGKEDVLFCRDMIITDKPTPPTEIPLPPANA